MSPVILCLIATIISYLIGSLSTGLLLSRRNGINIREYGSKNIGASNVMRVMGVKFGVLTYIGDFLKAVLACLIGKWILSYAHLEPQQLSLLIPALFVIIGHNWPVYHGFHGGKGVACSSAVILLIDPLIGGISIAAFFIVLLMKKYISLGSMLMLFTNMVLTIILHTAEPLQIIFSVILLALCMFRHRSNINRLLHHSETRIGESVEADIKPSDRDSKE